MSTTSNNAESSKRHAATPLDKQRAQLDKLLKDPSKPAYIPPPPKEKMIRPAREMMKNVQGSSAGAGSGEFHVYKAGRRREYERLKLMEDQSKKEADQQEFEQRKQEREQAIDAKTAKNRAKRQKKKERAKAASTETSKADADDGPIKKRRLVNGKELVFKKRDDRESDEEESGPAPGEQPSMADEEESPPAVPASDVAKITVHEDD
ncbi:hypothetical protein BJ322DRAFT_1216121 [Thelephora terrestris]|uniref:DUF1168-domain-containing protein n=1 Tax=Thelephora terrestris TaxID=56493 RepID=A0A9P6HUE0_9AGAM|nr:hypothetical protein BJ322DRAFT_1216121 [Thelephora terrestris]